MAGDGIAASARLGVENLEDRTGNGHLNEWVFVAPIVCTVIGTTVEAKAPGIGHIATAIDNIATAMSVSLVILFASFRCMVFLREYTG